ncbi:hypothetical protein [Micromonospora sp. CB01531]|uniref:hypothetical protein n=1 Tax=Micromonospora sp. CB01531 TaxID=1718947 RepID=UPI00093EE303|nr:hypothetical protein [Micromonospora sp. CB01531]OKI47308.1 hypothetical protein A6A27_10700 [Micromonospora sp. CB01531]
MSVHVEGVDRFRVVARRLKQAADRKELTRELRKGILKAVPDLKNAVREDAAAYLPDAYAEELVPALRMTTSSSFNGDQVTVRITVTAVGKGGNARHVGALEDGDLRHPVFGRSRALKRHAVHKATSKANPWVRQQVKPGFVSKSMNAGQPAVRREIEAAVDRVLDKIARG